MTAPFKKWQFPSAVSEVSHIECNLKEILIHMDLMVNDPDGRIQLKIDMSFVAGREEVACICRTDQ